jgi:hypothetical protein
MLQLEIYPMHVTGCWGRGYNILWQTNALQQLSLFMIIIIHYLSNKSISLEDVSITYTQILLGWGITMCFLKWETLHIFWGIRVQFDDRCAHVY